jgi:hypothetical protein
MNKKNSHELSNLMRTIHDSTDFEREIEALLDILKALSVEPELFNKHITQHTVHEFVQNLLKCIKEDGKKPSDTEKPDEFVNIMYLHQNKNLIVKSNVGKLEREELQESDFVVAFWELHSIGGVIRALIQADQLDANPEQLVKYYNDWSLHDVVKLLDDHVFRDFILDKVKEWENKTVKIRNMFFKRTSHSNDL